MKDVLSPNVYKHQIEYILNNDVTDLGVTLSYEDDEFGDVKTIDLIPNGRNIDLTEENKENYIQKLCNYKLELSIKF